MYEIDQIYELYGTRQKMYFIANKETWVNAYVLTNRPNVGGVSFPEYVIYRGEQVRNFDL